MRDRLNIISLSFKHWCKGENDEHASHQRFRAETFHRNCAQLQRGVDNSLLFQGYQLQLITGKQPITAWMFVKGTKDFYTPVSEELPPATIINVVLAQHWITGNTGMDHPKPVEYYQDPRQLFIGGLGKRLIPASVVARTLSEDGQFRIVESEQLAQ
jgi:hypothetical protein